MRKKIITIGRTYGSGGRLIGRYRNAICLVMDGGRMFTAADDTLSTEPFILASRPHPRLNPGFPLDSLSVDIATGQYYNDLPEKTLSQSAVDRGCLSFFAKVLKALA